ncbi:phosphatidate cytidylyltransferase [Beggiatoa leptomitoformis]|uniref:Phosphatidate cytidylyltransferase n=1 Tax=Beggiatoa leptomitoformis TaxID=288004 RepID=A0A2N9YEC4_9GAMM|nr:phosphatidate cytidylyltransferase [Beggiatoa leptomitoformis]ALG68805.1 phosphatidate cytidylyltransferase [Beggiatoa leptomitoformis]AUI68832.1 phosphatidate cytidylyltransferase [Beggiatoa leptomitoformis]
MLKQRILTASLLIPLLVICVLYFSTPFFALILGLFVLLGAWEWAGLSGWTNPHHKGIYTGLFAVLMGLVYFGLQAQTIMLGWFVSVASVGWLIALWWVWQYQQGQDYLPMQRQVKTALGIWILLPAWCALWMLHAGRGGRWVLFLLVLIWAADTGAYFAGRQWGKTKLADKVSPGKTWAGVWGALVLSLSVTLIFGSLLENLTVSAIILLLLIALLTVIASILGDLLESLFKRKAGVKDSGQLLPGHGGVLDRIDSLTAAAPIFVMSLFIVGSL